MIVPGGVDRSGERRVIPALLALIRYLAATNELHVFATHQDATPDRWMLEGATIHNVGTPRRLGRTLGLISAEHRRSRFDVTQSIWAGRSGALAVAAARYLRVPSAVHVAGGELVAIRDINYGGSLKLRSRALQGIVLRYAHKITAASQPICELIAQAGFRAERIPLGIDFEKWPLKPPERRNDREPARLVHIASLNAVKDQLTLLRAMQILKRRNCAFRLDIIGEDTLAGKTQEECRVLGLANEVSFHGFLSQPRMRPIVEQAHAAILSSRHEAGPIALIEAAAVGVPTVGTAVGHVLEWHPNAAIAVPIRDAAALADATEALLVDEDERMRLAESAHALARTYDAARTASRFNAVYEEIRSSFSR